MLLKWGILSVGKISEDFVLALKGLSPEHHSISAVAARDADRASAFAHKYQIQTSYGSYEELAKDENLDVVYVGTIHVHHFAAVKMLLNSGKHVLCEKPLAINLKQVKELTSLAREKELFLMQAVWSRCIPAYERIAEILQQGIIGELKYINCNFGYESNVDRIVKKVLGGGSLLDLGIYFVQFILFVTKEKPEDIKAVAHLNEEGVDKSLSCVFKFPSGTLAVGNSSFEAQYENYAVVYGTKGRIKVCEPFWCSTKIIVNSEAEEFPIPNSDIPTNFINSSGLQYEAEEVRKCIMNGLMESPLISSKETELITEIMDEIRNQVGVVYEEDSI